ncbi:unnamed protein product [Vicia faba]|uniref:Uncharacterized protein n=1 Tax=Vicia faba TaxID=3906 RepID=A0AAV0ZMI4_VICFA|nr:unnamed protein product [Vicia faba]
MELRMTTMENSFLQKIDEFRQSMLLEFAKLQDRRFPRSAHSFPFADDLVYESKLTMKEKEIDTKGNEFETQTLRTGIITNKEVEVLVVCPRDLRAK